MGTDVLPDLTQEQYEALRDDIRQRGVLSAVEVCARSGEVLDGRVRGAICLELKIRHYPRRVIAGLETEEARRHHRLRANCLRRQLDRAAVKALVLAEMKRKPQSDRLLASVFGVSHPTIGTWRREYSSTGKLLPVDEFKDVNGKTCRPTTIYATTPTTAARAADLLNELGDDAPGRELSPRAAEKILLGKRRERADARDVSLPSGVKLLEGKFQDVGRKVKDASVDLIWTDPPYSLEWVEQGQWGDLGTLAARVLKSGGVLATYRGVAYLDRVIPQVCAAGLDYLWMFSIRYSGLSCRNYPRNTVNKWKPILVFGKGRSGFAEAVPDSWDGEGRTKEHHEWEQPEAECVYWLPRLAGAGSMVLDPCCGSGTTLSCARRLRMQALGIDCDPEAVALARGRLCKGRSSRATSQPSLVGATSG